MWFLLTGTAPMIAPRGPVSVQPEAIGFTVDKLNGMPKRVQRLLAQMLSLDPALRPQDPLAFYRQIQECLAQLDRRESMARRFGIPLSSSSKAFAAPARRRLPAKALALAAILVALATVAGVMLPRYLHHERVRNAEVPIGVPIGVPDATVAPAPSPPAVATTNTAQTTEPAPTIRPLPADTAATTTAQTNTAPPPAPTNSRNKPTPQQQPVVAANPPAPAPQETVTTRQETAPTVTAKIPEQPKVAANETASVPQTQVSAAPQSSDAARTAAEETSASRNNKVAANQTRPAAQPAETAPSKGDEPVRTLAEEAPASRNKKVAANESRRFPQPEETVAPKPDEPVRTEPETVTTHRNEVAAVVPTARAVAPEVRRAEPPPAEGPEESAAPRVTTE